MSPLPTMLAGGKLALLTHTWVPPAGAAEDMLEALGRVPDLKDWRGISYPPCPRCWPLRVSVMLAGPDRTR